MSKKMCKPGGMCGTICSKCGKPQEYIEDFGCPEITKINYGDPYASYETVWIDEHRFNNVPTDLEDESRQSPRRIEDTSYEDESPYQNIKQEQDDASD